MELNKKAQFNYIDSHDYNKTSDEGYRNSNNVSRSGDFRNFRKLVFGSVLFGSIILIMGTFLKKGD